jgi:hypothetical protein
MTPPLLKCFLRVRDHTLSLAQWTFDQLSRLKHSNGRPMLAIFGKHSDPERDKVRMGGGRKEVRGTRCEDGVRQGGSSGRRGLAVQVIPFVDLAQSTLIPSLSRCKGR